MIYLVEVNKYLGEKDKIDYFENLCPKSYFETGHSETNRLEYGYDTLFAKST